MHSRPDLGVEISGTTSHLEQLTDLPLCHQGAANSDPKASRMPHSQKNARQPKLRVQDASRKSVAFMTSYHPTWTTALPGTCTWIELSPHAARVSAAVSSDKPPLARTAWASWSKGTLKGWCQPKSKSFTLREVPAVHVGASWTKSGRVALQLEVLRIWLDQPHWHEGLRVLRMKTRRPRLFSSTSTNIESVLCGAEMNVYVGMRRTRRTKYWEMVCQICLGGSSL